VRVGVVILPERRWRHSGELWRRAEDLGFDSAWMYDHLWWRSLGAGEWFATVPVLTAAACATSRIRIGTLVTSPNFRHPVVTASEAMTVDDISGGRFTLGIGAGSPGAGDSGVVDDTVLTPGERADRFAEFVELTDRLLRDPVTSYEGRFYRTSEARVIASCVQRPRVPFALAATGPRGLALVARYGQGWVTLGPPAFPEGVTPASCLAAVRDQTDRLRAACEAVDRDADEIDRIFVVTPAAGDPLASPESFEEMAVDYAKAGITHLVIHWPRAEGVYAGDPAMLERVAGEVLPRVRAL